MSYRKDKVLRVDHPTLWGGAPPPCLPAGRAPGLDSRGHGTWDIGEAVVQPCGHLWDPYAGFEPHAGGEP